MVMQMAAKTAKMMEPMLAVGRVQPMAAQTAEKMVSKMAAESAPWRAVP